MTITEPKVNDKFQIMASKGLEHEYISQGSKSVERRRDFFSDRMIHAA